MKFQELSYFFKEKKILITGSSGFKGSWLSLMLSLSGAKVFGFSNDYESKSSYPQKNFGNYKKGDITVYSQVENIVKLVQPEYIFHLAAQAITLKGYEMPRETFLTNVMGTTNVLEAIRSLNKPCKVVVITTDKCYKNNEWVWGYRENDVLAGKDPYSASKSAAEIVFSSYYNSFFKENNNIRIASCRAGNVVGGGDWSAYRVVPDCIRAWTRKKPVEIRHPNAIRPWNYVLDVIYGYLLVAVKLETDSINGESFNFGPMLDNEVSVKALVDLLWDSWHDKSFRHVIVNKQHPDYFEHIYLKLNCDKANSLLGWHPKMPINALLKATALWYQRSAKNKKNVSELSAEFIHNYFEL